MRQITFLAILILIGFSTACKKRIEKKFVGEYYGTYTFEDGYFVETESGPYWQDVYKEGEDTMTVFRSGDYLMVQGYDYKIHFDDMDKDGGTFSSFGGGHKSSYFRLYGNSMSVKWSRCIGCQTIYGTFIYYEFSGTKIK